MTTPCSHKCVCGRFYTNRQNLYRHRKHCFVVKNPTAKVAEVAESLPNVCHPYVCGCGRAYRHACSLSKHKRNCLHGVGNVVIQPNDHTVVLEAIDSLQDKMDLTHKSNVLLKEEIKHMKSSVEEPKVVNNYNNINVFLNERCADAQTIQDFVRGLVIGAEDVNYALENGKANGISNIIEKRFGDLGLYKRPVHCTDVKRGTVYVKGEGGWGKEPCEMPQITRLINGVERAQVKGIKSWEDAHPGCRQKGTKLADQWIAMVRCLTTNIEGASSKKISRRCRELSKIDQEDMM